MPSAPASTGPVAANTSIPGAGLYLAGRDVEIKLAIAIPAAVA